MIRRAVIGLVLAVLGAACGERGAKPTATITAPDTADQVLVSFSHYVTRDGIRRSRIEADTAYFFEPTQLTQLHRVHATFYDEKGAESSTMTADDASYHWQTGSLEARGHVVVTTPDGARLTSDQLNYDKTADQLSTDQPFVYISGKEHLEGTGFRADPGFRHVVTNQPHGSSGTPVEVPGQ